MPAFTLMIFSSLHGIAAAHAAGPLKAGIDASYWTLLGLLLVQLGVSASGRINAATNRFYGISVALQSGYTLGMGTLAVVLAWGSPGLAGTLLLGAAALGSVMLLGKGYAKEIFQGLKRSLFTYWPSRPAVAFLIMTYAALNSHNTSWGTKGLTRPDYLDDQAPRRFRKQHFDRFRVKTVALMLAANTGFFAFAASRGWMESFTGLRLVLGLFLAQVGIAWLGRVAIAFKARR
jgi:hypothetical protein